MLTPDFIQSVKSPTTPNGGTTQSQPMDDASFAKWSQPSQSNQSDTRNVVQKIGGAFADPLIKEAVRAGQAVGDVALEGANKLSSGAVDKFYQEHFGHTLQQGINQANSVPTKVPVVGTTVPPVNEDTPESMAGRALGTVALAAPGAASGGAELMAGNAMEQNKGAGEVTLDAIGGALGGKILEGAIGYASPYVTKAIEKFGQPLVDKLAEYVPKAAQDAFSKMAEKITSMTPSTEGKIMSEVASNTINKVNEGVNNIVEKPFQVMGNGVNAVKNTVAKMLPNSEGIMNRVARLTPTDANAFSKLSGMTQGEYLAKTGNFGAPDTIIKNEAQKFINSLNSVDTEMAKLPGVYESEPLKTMADELVARENRVSSSGAPSPDLAKVTELKNKLDSGGITMQETNDLKRIYERNVKLDFQRQNLPEQTARATNIDSAVRKWQFKTAKDLGLKNLPEMNKQTQISKFIIDKLGKQLVGKGGNDAMGLTDWIILAGHDPSSVGAFLTKKFFSSPGVQAKIASMISKEPSLNPIEAESSITPENINRRVNPQGFKALPEGNGGAQVQNNVPIKANAPFSAEAPAQRINRQIPVDTSVKLEGKGKNPIHLGSSKSK